ncbi:hypothetical protein [Kineosporia succinea]|uniref:Ribosomally synthesized peptide with SipW-like signal peptide n=1 Tax=Kineosporia succinea TaxID=84632 RepID=A0ABT9P703_9ACTN|nr:hypothetical protein [Kineosporia succinea]MDP9828456.1 hypothetical protein [Kineosporia succinea]
MLSKIRNPLVWALLATIVSGVSLVVAVLAYGRAGTTVVAEPQRTPAAASTEGATAEPQATTVEVTPAQDVTASASEEPLVTTLPSPGASYSLVREDVQMRLVGGETRYVDLDQPLVNATNEAYDVSFRTGLAQPKLSFQLNDVALGKSPTVTPDECAQEIQLSPVDSEVEVSQDLVLCAVTNGLGAVNEPARTKMARIVVNSVTKDNAVNLTVTTWEIPR